MATRADDPIQLLAEIERRARRCAAGLPQQEDVREQWSGIGFELGERPLLAPLGQVTEILTPPPLTRVPGARPWVLGIANVRGNLVPIMDLNGYVHGRRTAPAKGNRVLVISHRGLLAGLLVDRVLGLRHFELAARSDAAPPGEPELLAYLEPGFGVGEAHWAVFSIRRLAESAPFMQVAV